MNKDYSATKTFWKTYQNTSRDTWRYPRENNFKELNDKRVEMCILMHFFQNHMNQKYILELWEV